MRKLKPRPLPTTLPPNHADYSRERYRPGQAAEYLDISLALVYRLAATKKLSHRKVGGEFRFSQADLDAYREVNRVVAITAPTRRSTPPVAAAHHTEILPEGFKRRYM